MKRRSFLATAVAAAQTPVNRSKGMQDIQALVDKAKIAAAAQNAFGLKLLADEAAHKPHQNVFLSPLSVFLALAMTENGAAGKTREAMRYALAVPSGVSDGELHESASALTKVLGSREEVVLSIANALWSDRSLPLSPAFIKHSLDFYGADATMLDFLQPSAADVINGWVAQKTRGKIPNIVTPDIVAVSKAILTNAVYFQGRWRTQFSKTATREAVFHLAGGGEKKAMFMHQPTLRNAYRSGDGFEAVELPYGYSGVALYAILPTQGKSPEEALAKISLEKLIHGEQPFDLELRLPKFTMDFKAALKKPLMRMGMEIAFQYPGAEFAPIGSPLFYIGEVLHKTRLEVDEEGTVAAAATAVVMRPGSAMPQKLEKKTLVFDRPFGLLLCDENTRAVLFAGVIYQT